MEKGCGGGAQRGGKKERKKNKKKHTIGYTKIQCEICSQRRMRCSGRDLLTNGP